MWTRANTGTTTPVGRAARGREGPGPLPAQLQWEAMGTVRPFSCLAVGRLGLVLLVGSDHAAPVPPRHGHVSLL